MTLAVRVSGNKLVDASGNTLQLRGVDVSGLEFVTIDKAQPPPGGSAFDPWGGQKPNYAAIAAKGANAVRLPLNEQSYLSQTCFTTPTTPMLADPNGTYRATVAAEVAAANAAGLYVVLDLHKNAANVLLPGGTIKQTPLSNTSGQAEMADADNSLAFWNQVAKDFGSNLSVIFDLFNEPHLDNFVAPASTPVTSGTIPPGLPAVFPQSWTLLRDGGQGNLVYGNNTTYSQAYQSAGMQGMLNAVRNAGAANVVMVGGRSWAQDLSLWVQYRPIDPLNQMAASWHAYPSGQNPAYPSFPPGTLNQSFTGGSYDWAQEILAAGFPIIIGETGNGQASALFASSAPNGGLLAWADANDVSVFCWSWNVGWGTMISDASGTPISDGIAYEAWLLSHTGGSHVSTTQNGVGAIAYAASPAVFPPGSLVDHIAVVVTGSASGNATPRAQAIAPGTTSVTFTNLPPDTYTFSVQAMPATGAGFGTPVTGSFSITAVVTAISLNLPASASFTQP